MARVLARRSRFVLASNCLSNRAEAVSWAAVKRCQTQDGPIGTSSTRSSSSASPSKKIIDFAKIKTGPSLEYFLANPKDQNGPSSSSTTSTASDAIQTAQTSDNVPYLQAMAVSQSGAGKNVYFETYGCQMNVNDTGWLMVDGWQLVICFWWMVGWLHGWWMRGWNSD